MELTILTLPCRVCRDSYIYIYAVVRHYMGVCPNCRAVSDIKEEEMLMAVKILKVEKTIEVEEEVWVCDRPGCSKRFLPGEGKRFYASLAPITKDNKDNDISNVSVLAEWDLCPECVTSFATYASDRLSKKQGYRWDNGIVKRSKNKVTTPEIPDTVATGKVTLDTDEDSEGSF
jgi:hypothetical protein